jgi:hypothetical protein
MATTTNFGWETPDDTDLVKDGALAIRTLGSAIDTSLVDLKGGTTGQVLSKTSNTDMDFTWVTSDDANAIQNAIVDAKGDLIAASAADTPARLAVGNNGETLVADSSATTGLRYNPQNALANPVINGGFDIWQRGTSISLAASAGTTYTADRWCTQTGANQASTVSRQVTGDTTNLPNIQYCVRYQRNSGQTGTGTMTFLTAFETTNSLPLAGKAVTLSFYARSGSNFSSASSILGVKLDSGTGTDQQPFSGYTGAATVGSANVTLTTTWQRFVVTGTVGATATELNVQFFFTPVGTASTNDFYEVTGVQIDLGTYTASSAPTFRRSGGTLAGELQAAQRYYYRLKADAASRGLSAGMAYSTGFAWMHFNFPVEMRTRPTALEQSGTAGDYQMWKADSTKQVCTAVPVYDGMTTTRLAFFYTTTGSGLVAGNATYVESVNSNAFLGWSAEL